jgi:alpha-1,2-mannosyltransferase
MADGAPWPRGPQRAEAAAVRAMMDTMVSPRAADSVVHRLTGWVPVAISLALSLAYGLFVALHTYEVDLGVYLRLGGRYAFTPHLYSLGLPNTSLLFTYPPFAALLFAPLQHLVASVTTVQTVWTLCNLGALLGILVVSLRAVRPDLSRGQVRRLAGALSFPALMLNPVLVTLGFGQVNLVLTLLVLWDFLTERRVGSRQVPLGIATGIAAAVKLTPLFFVPFLLLTRRTRGAVTCLSTFAICELVTYAASPSSSAAYWTKAMFSPSRAGDLTIVKNQDLWAALDRVSHGVIPGGVMVPLLVAVAAGGLWLARTTHRHSSPMLGLLVCAGTSLLVSPISWSHHMVWVVPALVWLTLADDRPKWGRACAAGAAVLFWSAPIWWVPYEDTSDLHLDAVQLLAGNSFVLALTLFLAGVAVAVIRRPAVTLLPRRRALE